MNQKNLAMPPEIDPLRRRWQRLQTDWRVGCFFVLVALLLILIDQLGRA